MKVKLVALPENLEQAEKDLNAALAEVEQFFIVDIKFEADVAIIVYTGKREKK
jgi:hypothetical protein